MTWASLEEMVIKTIGEASNWAIPETGQEGNGVQFTRTTPITIRDRAKRLDKGE